MNALGKHLLSEPTRELAEFVSQLRFEDLPLDVIEKAKTCLLDSLGCCLFGSTLPWTCMVRDMVLEQGGAPHAQIIGTTHRTSVTQAVLVNSTAGHAFELDDAHTRASMHVGSTNVPVALALSEWLNTMSGRDFIAALVAGYEAGLRIGIGADGQIFKRGFHPTSVCGVFPAVATASRALGLDADQTQNALGIAGSLAAGLMAAQEGAMVKRLHVGHAGQSGLSAALLARRGFTGIRDVLEAPFGGFYNAFSGLWVPEHTTAGLGQIWEILQVGFKPYATAGGIHTSLAALDMIMAENELSATDIDRVDVQCTTWCFKHVGWPYVPRGVSGAQHNLFYALAVMAVDRAALIGQFAEDRLNDPHLFEFMKNIYVKPDPELDDLGHSRRYAIRMKVRTGDGKQFSCEMKNRPGSPEHALSGQQLVGKFRLLASHVLPEEIMDQVIEIVSTFETLQSTRTLSDQLLSAKRA